MPAMLPAAAASTALGTGAAIGAGIGGAGLALGGGIAAGTALAGGTGLVGLLGGLGGAGAGAAGSMLGGAALTPAVASLAPAATAQAMGPTLLQASLPGMTGGTVAPGAFGANLGGAAQGLAGAANPSLASQIAQQQTVANAARQNLLAQAGTKDVVGMGLQKAADPIGTTYGTQVINGRVVQSSMPPFNAPVVSNPNVITNTAQTTPGFSEAGFRGVQPSGLNYPSLSNPTATSVNPADIVGRSIRPDQNFMQNLGNIGSFQDVKDYADQHPYATSAMAGLGAMGIAKMMEPKKIPTPEDNAMIRPYEFDYNATNAAYEPGGSTSEQRYFNPTFTPLEPYKATEKAEGGIASAYAVGGPVEQMTALNSVGANTGYPMAEINTPVYSNPMMQRPQSTNVVAPSADAGVSAYSGEPRFASGGISHLGDYSDGGRLLKGPGDGVSDSIPASIGGRQPARLADGEFVVPARIVSELGNGSTEAGARKLYAMMERVQASRKKSIGKKKVAVNSKADKHLPA